MTGQIISPSFEADKTGNTIPQSCAKKQRQAILSHLQQGNRLTTLCAREELGIIHPAAHVMELRNDGYNIVIHQRRGHDSTGTRQSVAEYVLMNG